MDPMGMLILTYWLPSPISIPSFPSSPNLIRMLNVRRMGPENNIYTWWLNQPIWKICNRQIGSFPQVRMKTNKMKPPDMNSSGMLIHPRKFNIAPTKMMVGRWVSFWDCLLVKFPGCKNSLRQSNLRYGTFFFSSHTAPYQGRLYEPPGHGQVNSMIYSLTFSHKKPPHFFCPAVDMQSFSDLKPCGSICEEEFLYINSILDYWNTTRYE